MEGLRIQEIAQLPFKTREMTRKRVKPKLTPDCVESWMGGHRVQNMWNAQMRFKKWLVPTFLNGSGVRQVACDTEGTR